MKFQIGRTTAYFDEFQPPCPGAFQDTEIISIAGPVVHQPESIAQNNDWIRFQKEGVNHRIEPSAIPGLMLMLRDEPKQFWYIEIYTLEALIALSESVGHDLIVSEGYIDIYDDYRE